MQVFSLYSLCGAGVQFIQCAWHQLPSVHQPLLHQLTADSTAPVIIVRAPAFNSVNATGFVTTTVYVGMFGIACMHQVAALQLRSYDATCTGFAHHIEHIGVAVHLHATCT